MTGNLVPFKLVIEKVPFLEFGWRLLCFIVKPVISKEELKSNVLRFAFVDYVLAFSVALVTIALLPANENEVSFRQILKMFNFEWFALSFVYYTAIQFSVIYSLYCMVFKFRAKSDRYLMDAYFMALHFIRVHALVVVCAILGFIFIMSLYLNHGVMPQYFEYYFPRLKYSYEISLGFLLMSAWLYFLPVTLFIYRKSQKKSLWVCFKALIVSMLIYCFSFFINGLVPASFVERAFSQKGFCEVTSISPIRYKAPELYKESEWGKKCT